MSRHQKSFRLNTGCFWFSRSCFLLAIAYSTYASWFLFLLSSSDWVFLAFFLQHIPNFSFLFLLFLFPAFLLSGIAVANRTGGMVFQVQVQVLAQV